MKVKVLKAEGKGKKKVLITQKSVNNDEPPPSPNIKSNGLPTESSIKSSEVSYDYLFKIVLVGDVSVGKTQIRSRYCHNVFNADSRSTIGVEFAFKNIEIQGLNIKGQIWDTSGDERYRAVTSAYYRGAVGAIVAFDVTKYRTFQKLDSWLEQLRQYTHDDIVICIVGNKIDLLDRQVTTLEASEFAKDNRCFYMETSALDGTGINQAFYTVMEEIYNSQGGRGQPKRRSLTFTDDIVNLTGEKVEVDEKGYNPPMSYGNCCRL